MTYTKTDVKKMIDIYSNNPCLEVVDKLSVLLNKPRKSIISKLVKEGVYQRRGYRSKQGQIPITKLAVVRDIENALDVVLPSLDKAPKDTIKILRDEIIQLVEDRENALEELSVAIENDRIKTEMLSTGLSKKWLGGNIFERGLVLTDVDGDNIDALAVDGNNTDALAKVAVDGNNTDALAKVAAEGGEVGQ